MKAAAKHPHLAMRRASGALPQQAIVELVVVTGVETQLHLHHLQALLRRLQLA
jgi:hypothetical protein